MVRSTRLFTDNTDSYHNNAENRDLILCGMILDFFYVKFNLLFLKRKVIYLFAVNL